MDQASKTANDSHEIWAKFTRSRFTGLPLATGKPSSQVSRLDSEILAMERSIILARELRNEKLPINTLPAEVILEILLYLRDSAVDDPYTWLSASTHTCHRFCSIALSSPALWTRLSNQRCSTELVKTLVARSGNHPTHLAVYIAKSKTKEDVVQIALDFELNCAETLDFVDNNSHTSGKVVEWLFGIPMPFLRHLRVRQVYGLDLDPYPSPAYIPRSLESLQVDRGTFVWTSAVYDNLVELQLCDLNWESSQPSFDNFQDLFSRMHRLASLTLNRVTLDEESVPVDSCVQLPQSLKTFTMLNSISPVSDALSYASHPTLSSLTIETFEDTYPIEPPHLSNVLKHWSCLWISQAELSMELSLLATEQKEACEFTVSIHHNNPASAMAKPPCFSYTQFVDVQFRIDKSLAKTCALVRNLRLAVCGYRAHEVTDKIWHSLFKHLNRLHSITLTTSSLTTILPCLVESPSYLPNLNALSVVDESPDVVAARGWATKLDDVGHVHASWFSQWLSERKKQGIHGPTHLSLPPILRDRLSENL